MRIVVMTVGCALLAGFVAACGETSAAAASPSSAPGGSPTIRALSPKSGRVGTAVVITGSNFASSGNQVKFGLGYIGNLSSADGTTLRFVVPDNLNPCPPNSSDPCATVLVRVAQGPYPVVVIAPGGTSNTTTFTVTP